jgi:hypothetical protein
MVSLPSSSNALLLGSGCVDSAADPSGILSFLTNVLLFQPWFPFLCQISLQPKILDKQVLRHLNSFLIAKNSGFLSLRENKTGSGSLCFQSQRNYKTPSPLFSSLISNSLVDKGHCCRFENYVAQLWAWSEFRHL